MIGCKNSKAEGSRGRVRLRRLHFTRARSPLVKAVKRLSCFFFSFQTFSYLTSGNGKLFFSVSSVKLQRKSPDDIFAGRKTDLYCLGSGTLTMN